MAGEGVWPKTDGDILYDGDVNYLNNRVHFWNFINNTQTTGTGLLIHSATTWTLISGTSTIRTTDSGATWVAATTDLATLDGAMTECDANGAYAIVCGDTGNDVSFTINSGDVWTATTTAPANITTLYDVSFPTTTVAVLCGAVSSGVSIYRSTDNGANWVVASTGPTGTCCVIDMVNGSNGIAIDTSKNIWTTSDGGDNWTDSGQNSDGTPDQQANMVALTSTTYVMILNNGQVETGNTTSGGTRKSASMWIDVAGGSTYQPSNLVVANNGYYYHAMLLGSWRQSDGGKYALYWVILRSTDSGTTWGVSSPIPANMNLLLNSLPTSTDYSHAILREYDTNKLVLLLGTGNMFITFNENLT